LRRKGRTEENSVSVPVCRPVRGPEKVGGDGGEWGGKVFDLGVESGLNAHRVVEAIIAGDDVELGGGAARLDTHRSV
jgi:hypothetical protein